MPTAVCVHKTTESPRTHVLEGQQQAPTRSSAHTPQGSLPSLASLLPPSASISLLAPGNGIEAAAPFSRPFLAVGVVTAKESVFVSDSSKASRSPDIAFYGAPKALVQAPGVDV